MARTEARLRCSIWTDEDFTALKGSTQRLYALLLSQADLSYCGVLPYTPKRWAKLSSDGSERQVRKDIEALVEARFVVVDEDTEELLVRSLVKGDGILKSTNLTTAMWKAFRGVLSEPIRKVFLDELPEPFAKGFAEGFDEPPSAGSRVRSAGPPPPPLSPSPSSSPAGASASAEPQRAMTPEEEKIAEAARIVSDRHFARASNVKNPAAWKLEDLRRVFEEHGERMKALVLEHPDITANELAHWCETGRPPIRFTDQREPEPFEPPDPEFVKAKVDAARAAVGGQG